jgi:hypothetical protein
MGDQERIKLLRLHPRAKFANPLRNHHLPPTLHTPTTPPLARSANYGGTDHPWQGTEPTTLQVPQR